MLPCPKTHWLKIERSENGSLNQALHRGCLRTSQYQTFSPHWGEGLINQLSTTKEPHTIHFAVKARRIFDQVIQARSEVCSF